MSTKCHDVIEKASWNPITEECAKKKCAKCATLDLETICDFNTICHYKWKKGEKLETYNQAFESLNLQIDNVK